MHCQDQVLLNWLISCHVKLIFRSSDNNSCWLLCVELPASVGIFSPFLRFVCRLWQISISKQHVHTHAISMLAHERIFTVIQRPITSINGVAQLLPACLWSFLIIYSYRWMDMIFYFHACSSPAACLCRLQVRCAACQLRVKWRRWTHRLPTQTQQCYHPIPYQNSDASIISDPLFIFTCVRTLHA